MMYLLRLWAGVSQCKITQYLYVQKTNLPGVFSWFQRGVFNPDPQRPVKNWFWQRTILQAVFFSKTEWRTCWATWLSTWSPLSLQIFHQSIRPLTIQTFPTKCWRKFLFITPAFGVFFLHRPDRWKNATACSPSRWTAMWSCVCGAMISLISKSFTSFRWSFFMFATFATTITP